MMFSCWKKVRVFSAVAEIPFENWTELRTLYDNCCECCGEREDTTDRLIQNVIFYEHMQKNLTYIHSKNHLISNENTKNIIRSHQNQYGNIFSSRCVHYYAVFTQFESTFSSSKNNVHVTILYRCSSSGSIWKWRNNIRSSDVVQFVIHIYDLPLPTFQT